MYQGKTFLGIIPARGGSKGVPRKNIRPLAGKPLIAWTIEQARASRYLDRTIVSTEDEEIAHVAQACGGDVPFLRPPELARDDTPSIEPVLHAIGILEDYDYVVLLQDTSPFRAPEDIDGKIGREESYQRQKLPTVYQLNGAVYVNSCAFLLREHEFISEGTVGYPMPKERSFDIDDAMDFEMAEVLMDKIQR